MKRSAKCGNEAKSLLFLNSLFSSFFKSIKVADPYTPELLYYIKRYPGDYRYSIPITRGLLQFNVSFQG